MIATKLDLDTTGTRQPLPHYPDCAGVYILTDADGGVLYVGRSKQLCRRASHLTAMQQDGTNASGLSHIKAGLVRQRQDAGQVVNISFIETDDAIAKEAELMGKYNPPWNN